MSDQNKSDSSLSDKDHLFEFLAMSYAEFNITLKDINEEELENIGEAYEIKNLSPGIFLLPFPVNGVLHGPNSRFMVPLVCQRTGEPNSKAINIWFLCDISSPFTCLSVKSLEEFFGAGNVDASRFYPMAIQDHSARIECQVSKIGSNFEFVNILGADAMHSLGLSAIEGIDWHQRTFRLSKQ